MIARNKIAASALFAMCLVLAQYGVVRVSPVDWPVRIVVPLTIALAPLALWMHRRHVGVWVMFVGLAANLCVIVANGGLMPIERSSLAEAIGYEQADAYATGDWITGSKDVMVDRGQNGQLIALGDGIHVRIAGGGLIASPGDIVIWAGLMILAAEASISWQQSQKRARVEREERIARAQEALDDEKGRAEGGAATQT